MKPKKKVEPGTPAVRFDRRSVKGKYRRRNYLPIRSALRSVPRSAPPNPSPPQSVAGGGTPSNVVPSQGAEPPVAGGGTPSNVVPSQGAEPPVAGGGTPWVRNPLPTHRTHANFFILRGTLTPGNEIPVDFVGKTGAAEEATAAGWQRGRTRKSRERVETTARMGSSRTE
jgi:hypothetical protein